MFTQWRERLAASAAGLFRFLFRRLSTTFTRLPLPCVLKNEVEAWDMTSPIPKLTHTRNYCRNMSSVFGKGTSDMWYVKCGEWKLIVILNESMIFSIFFRLPATPMMFFFRCDVWLTPIDSWHTLAIIGSWARRCLLNWIYKEKSESDLRQKYL